jgi:hypothetical protein
VTTCNQTDAFEKCIASIFRLEEYVEKATLHIKQSGPSAGQQSLENETKTTQCLRYQNKESAKKYAVTIAFLDITHRLALYLKQTLRRLDSVSVFRWNILSWTLQIELVCLRAPEERKQLSKLDPTEKGPSEDGGRIQSPKRHCWETSQNGDLRRNKR